MVVLDANRFRRGACSKQSCGFSTLARSGTCCRTLCVNGKGCRNVPHTESCRRRLPHRTKLRGALDQRRVLAEIAGTD